MRTILLPALAVSSLLLGGCVAKTVWDVATLPVKAGAKAVDLATTSQSEADRNYGRKMRLAEQREGQERKAYEEACRKQPQRACASYNGYRAADHRDDDRY